MTVKLKTSSPRDTTKYTELYPGRRRKSRSAARDETKDGADKQDGEKVTSEETEGGEFFIRRM